MTTEEIKKRIEDIKKWADDPESAHSMEDKLYKDFIRHVAKVFQGASIADNARLVLTAGDIPFDRWYS